MSYRPFGKKMEEEVDGIEELDKAQYIFEIGKIYKEQKNDE